MLRFHLPFLLVILLLLPTASFAFDAGEADLDGDGLISLEDARILARDLATLAAPWRGDVNGDAYVRGDDLQLLLTVMLAEAMPESPERVENLVGPLIEQLLVGELPPVLAEGSDAVVIEAGDPAAGGLTEAIQRLRQGRAGRTRERLQAFWQAGQAANEVPKASNSPAGKD